MEFKRNRTWHIEGIKPGAIHKLREDQEDLFANALDSFSRQIWRKPRSRKPFRYDLAILHDPGEAFPPSDAKALKNFVRVGRSLGIDVDLIERKDYSRIAEYDALFIRETTNVADHTYRFAKKAESEGLVVMDDPVSILRCTNKVYLADLLRSHKLGMPATEILYKENPQELEKVGERLGFPLVLKIPDGSFSRGVIKVEDQEQLLAASAELFERSVLILPRSSSIPSTTGVSACSTASRSSPASTSCPRATGRSTTTARTPRRSAAISAPCPCTRRRARWWSWR